MGSREHLEDPMLLRDVVVELFENWPPGREEEND